VPLNVAEAIEDDDEGKLGLARLHDPREGRQRQLGVVGDDGARARQGEVSRLEHQRLSISRARTFGSDSP